MNKLIILVLLAVSVGILPMLAQTKTTATKKQTTTSKNKTPQKKPGSTTQKKQPASGKEDPSKPKAGLIAANKVDTFGLQ